MYMYVDNKETSGTSFVRKDTTEEERTRQKRRGHERRGQGRTGGPTSMECVVSTTERRAETLLIRSHILRLAVASIPVLGCRQTEGQRDREGKKLREREREQPIIIHIAIYIASTHTYN
jgi:hypothetical protein